MPIYEYICSACSHEKEVLQSLSDKVLKDCPACGKPDFVKKISAPGFRLKGGGWYETDFKTSGKKNIAGNAETDVKPEADKSPAKSKTSDVGADSK